MVVLFRKVVDNFLIIVHAVYQKALNFVSQSLLPIRKILPLANKWKDVNDEPGDLTVCRENSMYSSAELHGDARMSNEKRKT